MMNVASPLPQVTLEYKVERHPDARCAELIEDIETLNQALAEARAQLEARLAELKETL